MCVETLNMTDVAYALLYHNYRKATYDNGYGIFLNLLDYKLSGRSKYLIKVNKDFPSSKICHCCGAMHPEMNDLAVRVIKCGCGLTMNRDQNAAINILNEGLRMLNESFEVA